LKKLQNDNEEIIMNDFMGQQVYSSKGGTEADYNERAKAWHFKELRKISFSNQRFDYFNNKKQKRSKGGPT
jgi:hypothetical protein